MMALLRADAHVVRRRTITPRRESALADLIEIVAAASQEGCVGQVIVNLGRGGTIANIQIVQQDELQPLLVSVGAVAAK